MTTVAELLRRAAAAGNDARRDAEVLLAHCLGKSRAWLYTWPETEPSSQDIANYEALLEARSEGVPVAYLTGQREFWSLSLFVDRNTLIPRPDTETLVSWALELDTPPAARVLDMGTGSGAIALALASERPAWSVLAVDQSAAALEVAQANAQSLAIDAVAFCLSDWFENLPAGQFDLIVSNPPYVSEDDTHLCSDGLRFEPRDALVADDNGLADLATLVAAAPDWLLPGGWFLTEHGHEQGSAVRERMRAAGFTQVTTRQDLAGLERITGGRAAC